MGREHKTYHMKLRDQNWTISSMVVEEGANHVKNEENPDANHAEEERNARVEEGEKNAKLIL
jgi:hypothetical protein